VTRSKRQRRDAARDRVSAESYARRDAIYQDPDLVDALRRHFAPQIADAIREHDLFVVVTSRSLRVLNPWAILANANSLRPS
jgi:hypothetical protein